MGSGSRGETPRFKTVSLDHSVSGVSGLYLKAPFFPSALGHFSLSLNCLYKMLSRVV